MARVDEIADQIEEMIVEGVIFPGEKLSEVLIAQQLGVSRGPLREAIRTLEGRRLVRRTPNSGVRVANLSVEDIGQVLSVREALEGMSARQAAENMSLPQLNALKASLLEMRRLGSSNQAFRQGVHDNDFHVQIAKGSHNQWLEDILCRDLYALLRVIRFQAVSVGRGFQEVFGEHELIVDRIEKRDPEGAEAAMRRHIALGRDALIEQLRDGTSARKKLVSQP